MSKGLSSFPESERRRIAERRAASKVKGLGYYGALDYLNRVKRPATPQKVAGQLAGRSGSTDV